MQCISQRNNYLEQFRSQWHDVTNKLGSRSWSNGMGQWGGVGDGGKSGGVRHGCNSGGVGNGCNSGGVGHGCNSGMGCVWSCSVGVSSISSGWVFIRHSRVTIVSHGGGVSVRISRVSVLGQVMSSMGQVRSSMVGLSFSLGFTFNKMMVGCVDMVGQWAGVDAGCNSSGQWGGVGVSSIRGHMGVSGVKWVGRETIGNNLLGGINL